MRYPSDSGDGSPGRNTPGSPATAEQSRADETRQGAVNRFGHLFHLIGDAVVEFELLEYEPIVRAVNPAFCDIFGYNREEVLDEPLNEFIVPEEDTTSTSFDQRTAQGKENIAIVERQTKTGVREFLYRGVPYERPDGRQFGFAIYSDITEQRRYERHSHVIHRILRHNLRNDLSVIISVSGHLESSAGDPEVREFAATINSHAQRLASIGEETRTLEQVLEDAGEARPLDIDRLCRDAIAHATATVDGTVSLDVPDIRVLGIPQLEEALEALVENALIHAGDAPEVLVRARKVGSERVTLAVVDDGPGIPEHERGPVFENRDITQLEHGSGIGLWLARWTAEASGGDIEYERVGDRTVVRFVLRPA